MNGLVRNHPIIQKDVADETQETNMWDQDVDKDMPYIQSDMLDTKSQTHKENENIVTINYKKQYW